MSDAVAVAYEDGMSGIWCSMPAVVRKVIQIEHPRYPVLLGLDVTWPSGVFRTVAWADEFVSAQPE